MVCDEAGQVHVHLSEDLFLHGCHVFSVNNSLCLAGVLVNENFCQRLHTLNVQKAGVCDVNFFELVKEAICELRSGGLEFLLLLLFDAVNEVVEFHGLMVVDAHKLAWGGLQYF
jgi:hypothetical protein